MHDYRTELAAISADTSKGQNTDVFSSDFTLKRAGNLVRISIQTDTTAAINVVPNSGSALHLGNATANTLATFTFALDHGRTWNIQHSHSGDVAIEHCVVQEVQQ
tara:strand:- start:640 stop:954 length:315 start_codon:yes stop_codon:yes gene_type:complete